MLTLTQLVLLYLIKSQKYTAVYRFSINKSMMLRKEHQIMHI